MKNILTSIGVVGLLLASSAPMLGEESAPTQFKLLDVETAWTTTRQFRKDRDELPPQPARWDTPVDYLNGALHMRLEIITKPSDIEVTSMICLWQGPDECCTRRRRPELIEFRTPGVYYETYPSPGSGDDELGNEWWGQAKGDRFFHADADIDRVQVQWWAKNSAGDWKALRDHGRRGIDVKEDMGPEVQAHIPITYRLEIFVVAAGEKFTPPAHWDADAIPALQPQ